MSKALEARSAVLRHLKRAGWREDRWGNWLDPKRADRRYKLGERNLKLQAKHSSECGGGWFNLRSMPFGTLAVHYHFGRGDAILGEECAECRDRADDLDWLATATVAVQAEKGQVDELQGDGQS